MKIKEPQKAEVQFTVLRARQRPQTVAGYVTGRHSQTGLENGGTNLFTNVNAKKWV